MTPYDSEACPNLAAAMTDIAAVDERGLMPLERAREQVAGAAVFGPDNGDLLWAALLSLADGGELAATAERIEWQFHPRGRENLALVERYGETLVPWLRAQIRDGILVNLPWCIGPSLLALGSAEVFELLWGLRGYNDTAGMQQWQLVPPEALDDEALARGADWLVAQWCRRHEAVAMRELATRAVAGDARAIAVIRERAQIGPRAVLAGLAEVLGDDQAEALATALELPRSLTAEAVLAHLDRAASAIWPQFNYAADGRAEYFGMRLIACRSATGDGWGIVLERITGSYPDNFQVERFGYGSELEIDDPLLESAWIDLQLEGDDPLFHGGVIRGPGGELRLDEGLIDEHDLRPGLCCEVGYWPYRVLLIRAYLAAYPDCLWAAPADAAALLGVGDAEVLAVSDRFHHVIGPHGRQGVPEKPWELAPSQSEAYRSLARAIASRDPDVFEPGESNLDWRLHAHVDEPCGLPWASWRFAPGDGARDHLESALREAAITDRDDRGLAPLERARAIVSAAGAFARGSGERIGELYVQGSDRLWAALLSLADAGEFARECARLEWRLDPRGSPNNLAPWQRFGGELVAWFAAHIDDRRVLHDRPSCLRANLIACDNPAVVDLLVGLEGFAGPGAPGSPAAQLEAVWSEWIAARPELAYRRLAELTGGDRTAAERLRRCALLDHDGVRAALGDRADVIYQRIGAPTELCAEHVLARLDRAAASAATSFDAWPRFFCASYPGAAEYHGLRLIGARAPGRWGVVLERLTGYGRDASVARFLFDDRGRHDGHGGEHDQSIELADPGAETEPPDGADRLTERPDYWAQREAPAWTRRYRAQLRDAPEACWPDPAAALAALDLGPDAVVVVAVTAFEHACGTDLPPDTEARPWHRLPSQSPAYRSLARLLTGGEGQLDPGEPNTDWRRHAVFEV